MTGYRKAIEYVRDLIATGEAKVGDRLPSERAISEKLDISRNSTREALRILEYAGVIGSKHGSGNYITGDMTRGLSSVFEMMLLLQQTDKEEIYDFRCRMEMFICRMIIEKNVEDLSELGRAARAAKDAPLDKRAELDYRFHYELIKASGSGLVILLMTCISDMYEKWIEDVICQAPPEWAQRFGDCHIRIYENLMKKNIRECMAAVQEHYNLIEMTIRRTEEKEMLQYEELQHRSI